MGLVMDADELEIARSIEQAGYSRCASRIIVALAVNGNMGMKELKQATHSCQSAVSVAIKELEEKRMVNTYGHDTGKRFLKYAELIGDPVEMLARKVDTEQAANAKMITQAKQYTPTREGEHNG